MSTRALTLTDRTLESAHTHTHVCNTQTHAHKSVHTCPCTHPFTDCTHACMRAGPGGPCPGTDEPLAADSPCCPGRGRVPGTGGPEPWAASSHRSVAAPRRGPARSRPLALLKIIYGSSEHPCVRSAAESIPLPLTQPLSAIAKVPKRES